MPLPFLGAAGIVAAGIAMYNFFNDSDTDDYEDSETISPQDEKRSIIEKDIEKFKRNQIKRFKDKYGIDITFTSVIEIQRREIISPLTSSIAAFAYGGSPTKVKIVNSSEIEMKDVKIQEAKRECEEMEQLIQDLEKVCNMSIA
jgi:hypothetical protein